MASAGLSPLDLVLREGFKQERDWTDVFRTGGRGRGHSWQRHQLEQRYASPRQVWDSEQLPTGIRERAGELGVGGVRATGQLAGP